MSKAGRNRDVARAKITRMREEEARRARRRNVIAGLGAAAVAIVVAVVIVIAVAGSGSKAPGHPAGGRPALRLAALSTLGSLRAAPAPGPAGPEGVPMPNVPPLASTSAAATGATVDGIRCQAGEQSIFHIHAHLTIFVNGSQRQIPASIGIPGGQVQNSAQGPFIASGSCFYWLHTHAADGIIHIESPVQRVYTLGDFFDEWGQPLGPDVLGPVSGHVTAIYNDKLYLGNPRDIPLSKHAQIQLEVGRPLVAQQAISFPNGL